MNLRLIHLRGCRYKPRTPSRHEPKKVQVRPLLSSLISSIMGSWTKAATRENHEPSQSDCIFYHAGGVPRCANDHAERQLDRSQLARSRSSHPRGNSLWFHHVGVVVNTIFLVREIRRNEQH